MLSEGSNYLSWSGVDGVVAVVVVVVGIATVVSFYQIMGNGTVLGLGRARSISASAVVFL